MITTGINIEELRTLLKIEGVNVDFTDSELEVLVKSKIRELEGLIGIDINPVDRTSVKSDFTGSVYELDFYPVKQVAYLYLDNELVNPCDYHVNYDNGLVYLHDNLLKPDNHLHLYDYNRHYHHRIKPFKRSIRVNYTTGVSERDFQYLIIPLIKDMVGYTISYGKTNTRLNGMAGFVNSLHEGDTSMNFGSNNGSSNNNYGYSIGVNNRIDELSKKYKYSARIKWI